MTVSAKVALRSIAFKQSAFSDEVKESFRDLTGIIPDEIPVPNEVVFDVASGDISLEWRSARGYVLLKPLVDRCFSYGVNIQYTESDYVFSYGVSSYECGFPQHIKIHILSL